MVEIQVYEIPVESRTLPAGCCGMRRRASPTNREFKEKVRAKKKLIPVAEVIQGTNATSTH